MWVVFLVTFTTCANSYDNTVVRIGVLSYRDIDGLKVNFEELQSKLATAIPGHRFELRLLNVTDLRKAVKNGELEFVFTNSTQYVSLASEFGIQRIATLMLPESVSPEHALGSTILTLAGRSDVEKLSDLRGKRIAVVTNDAFGGYLAGARELLRAGVDLEAGDAQLVLVGLPMHLAIDVLRTHKADAAIVRTCLLEQLSKKGLLQPTDFKVVSPRPASGFRCVTSTQLYPDWPLASTQITDPIFAKAVAVALLSMPPSSMGVSWNIPADYQSIMELDQDLMIGPFAVLRTTTFRGLLNNYRPYLLIALFLFIGVIIYFIRVQILVRRRTAELRASQANARTLQRKAEHMARLSILGEMASTLAHELNQPLATIATYAQGLERHCANGQISIDMVAKVTGEIFAQTERADKVIRNVRAFARKRMGAYEFRPLADTVQEAINILSIALPNLPPVTVDNRLPAGKMLEADHLQLQQVLLNLMKNAAESMSELPLEQRVIKIILDRAGGDLTIAVIDNGPPISPETLNHLFEPFFTTKSDGLGLGLAICKSILEAHSGGLNVYPRTPNPGLVFLLNLPEFRHDG